jgi:hypothetical protein
MENKEFAKEAQDLLKNEVENYEGTLMAVSACEAQKMGSDIITTTHVQTAAAKLSAPD